MVAATAKRDEMVKMDLSIRQIVIFATCSTMLTIINSFTNCCYCNVDRNKDYAARLIYFAS